MEKLLSPWPGDRGLYGCSEQAEKIHFIPEEYAILDFLFEQETIKMALFRAVKPEPDVFMYREQTPNQPSLHLSLSIGLILTVGRMQRK